VTDGGWLRPAQAGMRRSHGWRGARRAAVALATAGLVLLPLAPGTIAADGLELVTDYPAVAVAPGSNVSFEIEVESDRAARVGLEVSGAPAGWTATLNGGGNVVDGVLVPADGATSVRLDVSVPADATGTRRITVDANDGARTASLPLDIRVSAEAAGDVTLTTNAPSLTGASDETFTFSLTFRNDTPEDLTVSAAAEGPAGWTVDTELTAESQAASVEVQAGSTTNISVEATPAAGTPAGTYPIRVTATAGAREVAGDLAVVVTGSYGMELATADVVLSARGSAGSAITKQLVITNNGTAPLESVTFSSTQPSEWTVTFDPETVESIAPNAEATVNAIITPSGDAISGDYAVTLRANSTEANDSVDLRVTVETSLLWGIVGVAIIVAVFVGLAWVFRRYGRR
jgi:uncharacterized membrane protein